MGSMDAPNARLDRSGERTLGIAEEFRFEQGLGNRRAIHHHKRLVSAAADQMDFLRDQVLAGSALAGDQDGCVAGRHHAGQSIGAQHGIGCSDHAAEFDLAFRQDPGIFGNRRRKRASPQRTSLIDNICELSGYRCRRCAPDQKLAGMGIQHHDLGMRKAVSDDPMKFARFKVRQRRIQKEHSVLGSVLVQQLQGFGSAARLEHVPSRKAQLSLEFLAEPGIRAHDKYVDGNSIFESPDLCSRGSHEAFSRLREMKN